MIMRRTRRASFWCWWRTFEYKAEECMNAFFWSWIRSFRWYLDKIRRLYILISFCFVTAIRYETDLKMLLEYRDYPSIPHPKAPPHNAKKIMNADQVSKCKIESSLLMCGWGIKELQQWVNKLFIALFIFLSPAHTMMKASKWWEDIASSSSVLTTIIR